MASIEQPYFWIIRFSLDMVVLVIISFLLRPLWKLTKTRTALVIVFSRAIGGFLRLLFDLPTYILELHLFDPRLAFWYAYLINGGVHTANMVQHTHNLALAINRAYGQFFPFHYSMVYAKNKRNNYVLCLGLWLICLVIGGTDAPIRIWTNYQYLWLSSDVLCNCCMYASGGVYLVLGARMLWTKYMKKSVFEGASSENDAIKILIVCLSCVFMSALYFIVLAPISVLTSRLGTDSVLRMIVFWGNYVAYLLGLCTEEISLALLVRDFRMHIKQQWQDIFSFCGVKNSPTQTVQQKQQQPIRANNMIKVNTLVKPMPNVMIMK